MSIVYSSEDPPSVILPDTHIVCFPVVSQKEIPDTDPDYMKRLYRDNPSADYYNNHSASVASRGKLGNYTLHTGIINLFIKLYPDGKSFNNDNNKVRLEHFKDCLDKLTNCKLKTLHFQFPSEDYIQHVEDFKSTYVLNNNTPINCIIHLNSIPQPETDTRLVFDSSQIQEQPFYEVDFVKYVIKKTATPPQVVVPTILDYFPDINRWNFIRNDAELLKISQTIPLDRVIGDTVYPPATDIFNAFTNSDPKVILLGQDPYHKSGQAHGLSFSVQPGITIPPSLRNVYKALTSDIPGFVSPKSGCLTAWAEQGVVLLNTSLTVDDGQPGSHLDIWEPFTDRLIELLSGQCKGLVFMLWGNKAKAKRKLISSKGGHLILEAQHPSPQIPNNTFGETCKHFSQANDFLISLKKTPIKW